MLLPQKFQGRLSAGSNLSSLATGLLCGLCSLLLNACSMQSPMVALGMQPGIEANSHTRLRFPAHTPVLVRFDATAAPEAWAIAAHQGIAQHFPAAQRQQAQTHGLEWFVRWPYSKPESAELATEPSPRHPAVVPNAERAPWYSIANANDRFGKLKQRLPSPFFWRRDDSDGDAQPPLPAPVRGLAQVVVSDRNNGKILALADVKIDQSVLLRSARERRGRISAAQRRVNNERQITQAFATLAASLVASGDS